MKSPLLNQPTKLHWLPLAVVGVAVTLASPLNLDAQTYSPPTTVNNATQTPVEGVGHDYLHDLNETVNPQNGQLSIRIAAPTPRERGALNFPLYAYMYDTSGRFALGGQLSINNCTATLGLEGCDARVDAPTWANMSTMLPVTGTIPGEDRIYYQSGAVSVNYGQDNGGQQTCSFWGPYMYEDPEGGLHSMNFISNLVGSTCGTTFQLATGPSSAYDTHYKMFTTGGMAPPIHVSDTHGNVFNGDGLQTAEDTNGNNRNGTGRPWSFTTTTNGPSQMPYASEGPGLNTVTLPGAANPSNNQAVPYTYQYASFPRNPNPGLSMAVTSGSTVNCNIDWSVSGLSSQFTDVSELVLPNEQYYSFGYDSTWGLVNSITYPTGAKVTYQWAVDPHSELSAVLTPAFYSSILPSSGVNAPASCYFEQDLPKIASRTVSYNGTTPAVEQTFSYSTTWGSFGWTSKKTTVTTTDLIRPGNPKTVTIYNYTPMPSGSPFSSLPSFSQTPVESSIIYEDGSGNTKLTVVKVWNSVNLMTAECNILDSQHISGKFYQYETVTNYGIVDEPTDVAEYDYSTGVTTACTQPSGTPTRETKMQYASLPSSALWNTSSLSSGAIPQINDRPSVIQVYSNGTLLSETDFTNYDQTNVASVASAMGHDETNYGPTVNTARGNVNTITRKCLQSCTNAITTATYDETGQVLSVVDADAHTTTLSYTDEYNEGGTPPGNTNTYVTTITRPSTNGVAHISTFKYHYMFGELAAATDESGNTTNYQYSDVWGRPTLATMPDGGKTQIQYNDAGPNPSVDKSVLMNSSESMTSETIEDGVGHVISTIVTSDPQGQTEVDTGYDGMGREYTVSNPYRGSPTYVTTKTYDPLGRISQITNPDNTSQTYSYSGSTVTFTDENLNQWTRQSDSFGRLVTVNEPNGASKTASMPTNYAYDAAGNLLSVNQVGTGTDGSARNRSFAYDSLSRLIGAFNPENTNSQGALQTCNGAPSGTKWSTCYGYDPNGNVLARTDNRGISASYSYDALNRVLSKSYSDSTTPSSCYQYDASSIGRLASEWTQAGTCSSSPPSSYQSLRVFGAYDAMGRVLTAQQCVQGYCTSTSVPSSPSPNCTTLSSTSGLQYCYDFAGNLLAFGNGVTTQTAGSYPQQAVLFSQTFDPANRLATVSSSWNDSTHPAALLSNATYSPANALSSWLLGPSLWTARQYDDRLRVCNQESAQQQITAPACK